MESSFAFREGWGTDEIGGPSPDVSVPHPCFARRGTRKCSGSSIKIWVDGNLKLDRTDSDIPWGAVGLSGWQAKFSDLTVGYDNTFPPDYDVDDGEDEVVLRGAFSAWPVSASGSLTMAEFSWPHSLPYV